MLIKSGSAKSTFVGDWWLQSSSIRKSKVIYFYYALINYALDQFLVYLSISFIIILAGLVMEPGWSGIAGLNALVIYIFVAE